MATPDSLDSVNAAAVSLTLTARGTMKAAMTTPLLTNAEGMQAMRKSGAAAAVYGPLTVVDKGKARRVSERLQIARPRGAVAMPPATRRRS